jgi:hypothetical protein
MEPPRQLFRAIPAPQRAAHSETFGRHERSAGGPVRQCWPSLMLLLLLPACASTPAHPPDISAASDAVWHHYVNQRVAFRGVLSLRGKIGALVVVAGRPIYVVSHDNFTWGEPYVSMENREVEVTGTLRYAPRAMPVTDTVAASPEHFFIDAETASIRLVQKR